MGFETEINVINSQVDTTPPVLTEFSFTPTELNLDEGESDITFSFVIIDDLSGISPPIKFEISSPSNIKYVIHLSCPDSQECIDDIVYTFDEFSESGIWIVNYIFLRDHNMNDHHYNTEELNSMGFETEINVINTQHKK